MYLGRLGVLRKVRSAVSAMGVLYFCGASVVTHATIPKSERDALISIYQATNGNQWADNTNWCDGRCPVTGAARFNKRGTECAWFGVSCDPSERNVIEIAMDANQLSGTLPSLQGITQLRLLYIVHNLVTGSIPDFSGMTVLDTINLSFNQLTGPVPDFSGLPNLADVDLSNNQLSSSIAPLTNLPLLQSFRVSNNRLTGPIPSFAGLYFLGLITVDGNSFSGPIPDFSQLNVSIFYADHNQLTGPLPPASGFFARRSARICPNPLHLSPSANDAAWNYATGTSPWWGPPGEGCDHVFSDSFE